MISREDMQEVVGRYKKPLPLILGSHSALDTLDGARAYGFKRLLYAPLERAKIYLRHPIVGDAKEDIDNLPEVVKRDLLVTEDISKIKKDGDWKTAILIVDKYDDVLKSEYLDHLLELEAIQLPNRAFSVYVGGYACKKIEDDFTIPILGSRLLLKIENREEVKENYYHLLEKADIPHPKEIKYKVKDDGIEFEEEIDYPLVLKIPFASRRLERGFLFAANGEEMMKKVKEALGEGHIITEDLGDGRAEEYVPGVTANMNLFASPIDKKASLGGLDKYYEGGLLGSQFISVDMRYETTHDGINRMHARDQLEANWLKTPYPESFEVVAHGMESLRESLLRLVFPIVDKFEKGCENVYGQPMIGAYCIQSLITFKEKPKVTGASVGVYDVPEDKSVYDFEFMTQDLAVRLGGGTNCVMGIGGQYGNILFNKQGFSMGRRIGLELKKAVDKRMLPEIVT